MNQEHWTQPGTSNDEFFRLRREKAERELHRPPVKQPKQRSLDFFELPLGDGQ